MKGRFNRKFFRKIIFFKFILSSATKKPFVLMNLHNFNFITMPQKTAHGFPIYKISSFSFFWNL